MPYTKALPPKRVTRYTRKGMAIVNPRVPRKLTSRTGPRPGLACGSGGTEHPATGSGRLANLLQRAHAE
jgi:hypothetical protein